MSGLPLLVISIVCVLGLWQCAASPAGAASVVIPASDFKGGAAQRFGSAHFDTNGVNFVYARPTEELSRMTATFDLPRGPSAPMVLELRGRDDDADTACVIEITLNDALLFAGKNPFPSDAFAHHVFPIPAAALRAGRNELTIANTEPAGEAGQALPRGDAVKAAIRIVAVTVVTCLAPPRLAQAPTTVPVLPVDVPPVAPDLIQQVRTATRDAKPGDTIELPSGTWQDVELVLEAKGTDEKPITIRAAEPGKAVFTGNSAIRFAGRHLVVDGVLFTGATDSKQPPTVFADDSSDCRLTNSAIVDFAAADRFHYVRVGGNYQRVDHCLFSGKTNMNPVLAAAGGQHVRIDHNHFRDIPHVTSNGKEIIQIVGIGSNDEPLDAGGAYWLVERNLFERAHGEGSEIISIKSNHNVIRENTVRATRGALTMRAGGGNTFEGNFIFGENAPGTAGLRISGANARAVNNYITGVTGVALQLHAGEYIEKDLTGKYEPLKRTGSPLGHVARYLHLKDGVVANNVLVDNPGHDLVYGSGYGSGWPGAQRVWLPDNLTFANNIAVTRTPVADKTALQLNLGDDRSALIPPAAQPRPMRGTNNYLFGAAPGIDPVPPMLGFRLEDPKLVARDDGLSLPAADSPAVAGGFDVRPFETFKPLTAADVGPGWSRR
jgi:poly(beta-D-mannuronate) lyase